MSHAIKPQTQFQINSNKNDGEQKIAHLVPCKIAYTGPAPVSSYFSSEKLQTPGEMDVSTFRGRLLFGHDAILPDGYEFYAARKLKGSDLSVFQINSNECQSLRLWDVDAEACSRRESPAQRSLNYLKVAQDLAQSDVEDE